MGDVHVANARDVKVVYTHLHVLNSQSDFSRLHHAQN